MTPPPSGHCTAPTLAKLLTITERRVQQLAQQNIIIKSGRGHYELIGSVQGYISYLQRCLTQRSLEEGPGLQVERKRLLRLQADKTAHELAELRKELIPLSVIDSVLQELGQLFISGLEALPNRLATVLTRVVEPAEWRRQIFDECRHLRRRTAQQLHRLADGFKPSATASRTDRCAETPHAE